MAARWASRTPTRSAPARGSARGRWCGCRCAATVRQRQTRRKRPNEVDMSDILIVDDERDIRELISDILEDEGYDTRLAGNSDEAVSAIAEAPPGLLIL